jgi:cytochrome c
MKAPLRHAILPTLLLPLAGTAAPLDGALLYTGKTCFTCHGPDGKTPTMALYPSLAGQSAEYSYAQMRDIKSGARNNSLSATMRGPMTLVSDAEMRAIADWLATVK